MLLDHVKESEVIVLLQTKNVLTRPWVILELYTAITHGVPLVALKVQNSYPYDYGEALEFLTHFDENIEIANPGAAQMLMGLGADPQDVAYRLSEVLPNIISTDFNPNASAGMLDAMINDLKQSMACAAPQSPGVGKEEWLAQRGTRKAQPVGQRLDEHGRGGKGGGPPSSSESTRAVIPSTVPDLPGAYLPRSTDLAALKVALLSDQTSSSTAQAYPKVSAYGMGGVGKTTIAASLVHESDVRSSFTKIAWVAVGQEPDVRELQSSIHFQLSKHHLPEQAKEQDERLQALKDAAAGTKVLLVLDDVWDSSMEKLLNCIDLEAGSCLLVTTRVRKLLTKSTDIELGVLPQDEALKLLLASAEMTDEVSDGSDEHGLAFEVVELCGRLPLTLAIAGGMVADVGQGFTEDILEAMMEACGANLEDEGGLALEERVISSSLKMIKGKNKALVERVFKFFAVFPEDVAVPAGVFNALAPLVSGDITTGSKVRLAVGSCLGTLVKFNLLKGSISGTGVFMHDIVREYVISQHEGSELRMLQHDVVEGVLAARPEPGGFDEYAPAGTFDGYVARQLHWHIRGALADEGEPPD